MRVVLTREEVFYTITKHAAVIRMKTGVRRDGTLVARECEIHLDTGAYAEIGPRVAKKSGYTAAGPYKIPNLKIDSYSVYTNKPPAGAFRGFGVSQSAWAVESQMDIIAAALKRDPLELRKQNGYDEGDKFVTEETLRAVGLKECLDQVARSIGWETKVQRSQSLKGQGKEETNIKRGKGLACMIKATITPSISCAVVKLNEDGSLSIYAGTVEMGQGRFSASTPTWCRTISRLRRAARRFTWARRCSWRRGISCAS
ncbi:MAG: molybdopterin-dependent oxidoreductase [Deltaproteobacteria bacterium]|nr:molybdopterin-dependent oxidoreductase [Deltaproteobacteria bacterium]